MTKILAVNGSPRHEGNTSHMLNIVLDICKNAGIETELYQRHCHMEITTLIIPGENDSEEEIAELARWLASLDPAIPLHLTRFFPRHHYSDKAPTPRETIYRLSETAQKYLKNVFTGNMV